MRNGTITNEDLLKLEKALRISLHPVQPNQKFIGLLRKRLKEEGSQDHSQRIAVSFLTIAAGLISGLVVFLIGQIITKGKS